LPVPISLFGRALLDIENQPVEHFVTEWSHCLPRPLLANRVRSREPEAGSAHAFIVEQAGAHGMSAITTDEPPILMGD